MRSTDDQCLRLKAVETAAQGLEFPAAGHLTQMASTTRVVDLRGLRYRMAGMAAMIIEARTRVLLHEICHPMIKALDRPMIKRGRAHHTLTRTTTHAVLRGTTLCHLALCTLRTTPIATTRLTRRPIETTADFHQQDHLVCRRVVVEGWALDLWTIDVRITIGTPTSLPTRTQTRTTVFLLP